MTQKSPLQKLNSALTDASNAVGELISDIKDCSVNHHTTAALNIAIRIDQCIDDALGKAIGLEEYARQQADRD